MRGVIATKHTQVLYYRSRQGGGSDRTQHGEHNRPCWPSASWSSWRRIPTMGRRPALTGREGERPPTEMPRKERPKNERWEPGAHVFIACGRSSKERPPRRKPAKQVSPCCLQNNVSSASCCSGHNCPGDGHPGARGCSSERANSASMSVRRETSKIVWLWRRNPT